MRIIILFSCLIFLFASCKNDIIAPPNQKDVFAKYYGYVKNETGVDIQPTATGGYILLGSSNSYATSTEGDYDFFLAEVDSLGNELWSKTYGYDLTDGYDNEIVTKICQNTGSCVFDERGKRIIVLNDGSGYLLVGSRQRKEIDNQGETSTQEKYIMVVRVDLTGNVSNTPYFARYSTITGYLNTDGSGIAQEDDIYDIEELSDGAFFIVGETSIVGTTGDKDDSDFLLLKLYSDFDTRNDPIDWQQRYGFSGKDVATEALIISTDATNYYVTGYTEDSLSEFQSRYGFLRCNAESGNLTNALQQAETAYFVESESACVDEANEKIYLLASSQEFTASTGTVGVTQALSIMQIGYDFNTTSAVTTDIALADIQASLNATAAANIGQSSGGSSTTIDEVDPKKIVLLSDNQGFIVVAEANHTKFVYGSNKTDTDQDILLIKLDATLGLEWVQAYGAYGTDEVGNILFTDQAISNTTATQISEYIFTGTFDKSTDTQMGLMKVDANGRFTPSAN